MAQLGALLHTTFGRYRIGPDTFIANQTGPEVPASLPITDVVGLNTLERMLTAPEAAKVGLACCELVLAQPEPSATLVLAKKYR